MIRKGEIYQRACCLRESNIWDGHLPASGKQCKAFLSPASLTVPCSWAAMVVVVVVVESPVSLR